MVREQDLQNLLWFSGKCPHIDLLNLNIIFGFIIFHHSKHFQL